uniref:Movement protein n=1 Tax=Haemonchus contortus TaxID=6289 RepID=A0A7I4Y5Y8_HAECO
MTTTYMTLTGNSNRLLTLVLSSHGQCATRSGSIGSIRWVCISSFCTGFRSKHRRDACRISNNGLGRRRTCAVSRAGARVLLELDLSEEALLAPTPEPAASMEPGNGQLAQSMEDLSLLSPAVPASPSSADPALRVSFGTIGWPDGAGPSGIPLPPAPPAAPRCRGGPPSGRGGIVHVSARGAPAGERSRPRPRRGRAPVARHNVPPQRPYYPHLLDNPLPVRENYLLSLHPWSRYVDLRPRSMVTFGHNRITNELPVSTYRHLPDAAYMSIKFVRPLFPNFVARRQPYPDPIPFIELQHLEDSIEIRFITESTITSVQGRYRDIDVDNIPP